MPVATERYERPLIELFLSAYEDGIWAAHPIEWPEDENDGAVDALARNAAAQVLVIEHTLIQPFVNEKQDSHRFLKVFEPIEKDPSLRIPEQQITLGIPVHAIQTGWRDWGAIGRAVHQWFAAERHNFPEGGSRHSIQVTGSSRGGPNTLDLQVELMLLPGLPGSMCIARYGVPADLNKVVEAALNAKLNKLVNTPAHKRILLLEVNQSIPGCLTVAKKVARQRRKFMDLEAVDEIWYAGTLACPEFVHFDLIEYKKGLVEQLWFKNGRFDRRRDLRAELM